MRIAVTGSRLFADTKMVGKAMTKLQAKLTRDAPADKLPGITSIVHGDARGADTLVHNWAVRHGFHHVRDGDWTKLQDPALAYHIWGKHVIPVEANWDQFDLKAGRIRNELMKNMGIELLFAFPGNAGTLDMVRRCRRAKIRIIFAEDFLLDDYEAGAQYEL